MFSYELFCADELIIMTLSLQYYVNKDLLVNTHSFIETFLSSLLDNNIRLCLKNERVTLPCYQSHRSPEHSRNSKLKVYNELEHSNTTYIFRTKSI